MDQFGFRMGGFIDPFQSILKVMDAHHELDFMKLCFQAGEGFLPHCFDWVVNLKNPEATEDEMRAELKICDDPGTRGIGWATGNIHFCNRPTIIRQAASRQLYPDGEVMDEGRYTLAARALGLHASVLLGTLFEHSRIGDRTDTWKDM